MNSYGIQLEVALAIMGVLSLMLDAFIPRLNERRLGCGFALACLFLFAWSFTIHPVDAPLFHGQYRLDAYALFFKRLFLLATALVLVMATEHVPTKQIGAAECYALMLFASVGMMLLASVNDFVLMFVSLELVAISFYILCSYLRKNLSSLEAGVKYLVLGALSGGFTLYGVSFVFGATGTTQFDEILRQVAAHGPSVPYTFGIALVTMGLGFKIASVPMQIWAPDVYEGAPTPVTAFLATGSKMAGFAMLLRLVQMGLVPHNEQWTTALMVLAGATLVYGNFGALPQRDIKRLLGYSSIGHAGYLLMGVAAGNPFGSAAVLFYLAQYLFTVACAFLAIVAIRNATNSVDVSSFAGLHRRSPLLAAAMFMSMMSLAGIPPFSGAFGKFFLFLSVIKAGAVDPRFFILAGVGAVSVVVSLVFYLGIIHSIYTMNPVELTAIRVSKPIRIALAIAMGSVLLLGMFQRPLLTACLALAR